MSPVLQHNHFNYQKHVQLNYYFLILVQEDIQTKAHRSMRSQLTSWQSSMLAAKKARSRIRYDVSNLRACLLRMVSMKNVSEFTKSSFWELLRLQLIRVMLVYIHTQSHTHFRLHSQNGHLCLSSPYTFVLIHMCAVMFAHTIHMHIHTHTLTHRCASALLHICTFTFALTSE